MSTDDCGDAHVSDEARHARRIPAHLSFRSVPAHHDIGMKILGPFLSIEDADTFFFMRGFPDFQSREPMKARFYDGELWKTELEGLLMPVLEQYDVVLVDDPDERIKW